jgi:hypothetical protein
MHHHSFVISALEYIFESEWRLVDLWLNIEDLLNVWRHCSLTTLSLYCFIYLISLFVMHFRHSFGCLFILFGNIIIFSILLLRFVLFWRMHLLLNLLLIFTFYRTTFAAIFGLLLLPVHLAKFCEKLWLFLVFVVALSLGFQSNARIVAMILL